MPSRIACRASCIACRASRIACRASCIAAAQQRSWVFARKRAAARGKSSSLELLSYAITPWLQHQTDRLTCTVKGGRASTLSFYSMRPDVAALMHSKNQHRMVVLLVLVQCEYRKYEPINVMVGAVPQCEHRHRRVTL